jgi:hypothetical protein
VVARAQEPPQRQVVHLLRACVRVTMADESFS